MVKLHWDARSLCQPKAVFPRRTPTCRYVGTTRDQTSRTLGMKDKISIHYTTSFASDYIRVKSNPSSPNSRSLVSNALHFLIDFGIGKWNLSWYFANVQKALNFSVKMCPTCSGAFLINITLSLVVTTKPQFAASNSLAAAVYCFLLTLRKCLGPFKNEWYVPTGDTLSSIADMMLWCMFNAPFDVHCVLLVLKLALKILGMADAACIACMFKHIEAIIDEMNK